MKKSQLIILLIVCALLVITGFWLIQRDKSHWRDIKMDSCLLGNLDVDAVTKILITTPDKKLEIAYKYSHWRVEQLNAYPANTELLRILLEQLTTIKPARAVRATPEQYGRLGLEMPEKGKKNSAVMLEIYVDHNNTGGIVLFGKEYFLKNPENNKLPPGLVPEVADGRYVLVDGTNRPVLMPVTFKYVVPDPVQWADHSFINPKDVLSISMTRLPKEAWEIFRKTPREKFGFAGAKLRMPPNPKQVASLTSALKQLPFTHVMLRKDLPADAFKKESTLSVSCGNGIGYILHIGESPDKKFYLKADLQKAGKKSEKAEFFTRWGYEIPKNYFNTLTPTAKTMQQPPAKNPFSPQMLMRR